MEMIIKLKMERVLEILFMLLIFRTFILKVLKKINFLNKSVLLNCGYGKGLTVMQVVKEFKKVSKKNMKINIQSRRKADLGKIVADNRRLRKFIKWKPKYNNLKFMVKSSLMWEKKINN